MSDVNEDGKQKDAIDGILNDLRAERERRQKAEVALAERESEKSKYANELAEHQKRLEEAAAKLAALDELTAKHTALEQVHIETVTRYQRESALADMGVVDKEAREFALFKYERTDKTKEFDVWLEEQKQSAPSWLMPQNGKQFMPPTGVQRGTAPRAGDEAEMLSSLSQDEKVAHYREKFKSLPGFAKRS